MLRHERTELDAAAELTHLSITGGASMLRRVAETARTITRGSHAWVARRLPQPGQVEVIATAGADAPAAGSRGDAPAAAPPRRIVLPLSLDGVPLGMLVAEGISAPLDPGSQRELSLAAGLGALALHNHTLILDAERRATEQAQRHFRLLSGTIYHLKNTLSVASEYSELMETGGPLTAAQQEHAARARRSIATAMRLLSELHELGRTEAGEVVPHMEPLQLDVMIRDIMQDHRLASGTTGVTLTVEMPVLPSVYTDPDCVRQVLDNLLSNAVRYSPAHGEVHVRVSTQRGRRSTDPEQWLRIEVTDAGPGVFEEDEVFEEVHRVERKGSPGFRLAISRRIARLLGGDLTLQNGENGATFTLWLPYHHGA